MGRHRVALYVSIFAPKALSGKIQGPQLFIRCNQCLGKIRDHPWTNKVSRNTKLHKSCRSNDIVYGLPLGCISYSHGLLDSITNMVASDFVVTWHV